MLDRTDRHCRFFMRLLSRHALLYTEMLSTGALIHGDRDYLLRYNPEEHPVALQLGGSDPSELARCAGYGHDCGYDEINLNVGCPSDRVQTGRFGACLMAAPRLLAECVAAMRATVPLPVTVKTRLGIDDCDSYEELCEFIATVATAGCYTFILHARKAWLRGLSPKENREVPPLEYDKVYRIKRDFPDLTIVINGGITAVAQGQAQFSRVDGIMIGREVYQNPYLLAQMDRDVFGEPVIPSREEVLDRYRTYAGRELRAGVELRHLTRHLLGLFHSQPGARTWRRYLSRRAADGGQSERIIGEALREAGRSANRAASPAPATMAG